MSDREQYVEDLQNYFDNLKLEMAKTTKKSKVECRKHCLSMIKTLNEIRKVANEERKAMPIKSKKGETESTEAKDNVKIDTDEKIKPVVKKQYKTLTERAREKKQ
jgi:hypothetical protein